MFNKTFQRSVILGRLTKDVELRFLPDGTPVANFSLIVEEPNGDKNVVPCVAWKNKARALADNVQKGSLVYVEGILKSSVAKDSEDRTQFYLKFQVGDKMLFFDNKKEEPVLSKEKEVE